MGATCCSKDTVKEFEWDDRPVPRHLKNRKPSTVTVIDLYEIRQCTAVAQDAFKSLTLESRLQRAKERIWEKKLGLHRKVLPCQASPTDLRTCKAVGTLASKAPYAPAVSIVTDLPHELDSTLLSLAAEGIPESLRASVWNLALHQDHHTAVDEDALESTTSKASLLHGSPSLPGRCIFSYFEMIKNIPPAPTSTEGKKDEGTSETTHQIWIDVARTLAHHPRLAGHHPWAKENREMLFRLITAFVQMPDQSSQGYTQGMNLIAAVLWLVVGEEMAFRGMRTMFHRGLRELYDEDFKSLKKLQKKFDENLLRTHPKVVGRMQTMGIDSGMFSTSWFLTCFTYNLKLDCVILIWDVIITSKRRIPEVLVAFAVAMIGTLKKTLLRASFDDIIDTLVRLPFATDDIPPLCKRAVKILGG
uniref:Rab-GAP TBC domain-containing protein n=1 Tax=Lotharella globosa TaxID=91324 RepID=A0A6V3US20_9EUKA|mmetsp:Transcript_14536/g.29392  ORF Transcript_14536/g.29392 Transcript_14536/m.29392 type:complete len:417 (+) Transcript_14536:77-1327(+)